MTEKMYLNAMGVTEMTQFELLSRDGGVAPGPNGEGCTERGLPDILKKYDPFGLLSNF
jgi:hypothetical protein